MVRLSRWEGCFITLHLCFPLQYSWFEVCGNPGAFAASAIWHKMTFQISVYCCRKSSSEGTWDMEQQRKPEMTMWKWSENEDTKSLFILPRRLNAEWGNVKRGLISEQKKQRQEGESVMESQVENQIEVEQRSKWRQIKKRWETEVWGWDLIWTKSSLNTRTQPITQITLGDSFYLKQCTGLITPLCCDVSLW